MGRNALKKIYMKKLPRSVASPPKDERLREELALRSLERATYIETHNIVLANPPPVDFSSAAARLLLVKHQMAREAAALEFNRYYLDMEGRDTSSLAPRIVSILQKISEIDLEVKKLGSAIVDPRSEEVRQMVAVWVQTLTTTLTGMVRENLMPAQTMDLFVSKFSEALEGWEDRVGRS